MPIYEYRCLECGKKFEVLTFKVGETTKPACTHCGSSTCQRLISKVRVLRSEESRFERLADPSSLGGLDEKDPKSLARWVKRMGQEAGEDIGDDEIDEMIEQSSKEEGEEEP